MTLRFWFTGSIYYGFSPWKWEVTGNRRWDHLFGTDEPIKDIIMRGYDLGMGYEELEGIIMHDPAHYDERGFCTNDELKNYIRDEMYVDFDYAGLAGEFK